MFENVPFICLYPCLDIKLHTAMLFSLLHILEILVDWSVFCHKCGLVQLFFLFLQILPQMLICCILIYFCSKKFMIAIILVCRFYQNTDFPFVHFDTFVVFVLAVI
jgi:hypothetical protein